MVNDLLSYGYRFKKLGLQKYLDIISDVLRYYLTYYPRSYVDVFLVLFDKHYEQIVKELGLLDKRFLWSIFKNFSRELHQRNQSIPIPIVVDYVHVSALVLYLSYKYNIDNFDKLSIVSFLIDNGYQLLERKTEFDKSLRDLMTIIIDEFDNLSQTDYIAILRKLHEKFKYHLYEIIVKGLEISEYPVVKSERFEILKLVDQLHCPSRTTTMALYKEIEKRLLLYKEKGTFEDFKVDFERVLTLTHKILELGWC